MATDGGHGISEKELTCAICTEILYQPLTLLDCLHTFCGACLKEWFKWQASSASAHPPTRNRSSSPYTCPSCREFVRRTKADWRLTTLLEGFLKANPGKVKSEVEREELAQLYKPGEDVLVPVRRGVAGEEGEDERVLAQVREFSVADAERETARRRAERAARRGYRQSPGETRQHQHYSSSIHPAPRHAVLNESSMADQHASAPHIEHQPSLRDLLSTADDSQDVQADILRSIYADGLLEGIDLDNLTTEQEEELTERIAQAYRRRQRVRGGTRDRAGTRRERTPPRAPPVAVDAVSPRATDGEVNVGQQAQPRARSPVQRPNVTGLTVQRPPRNQRRSRSSASQISNVAEGTNDSTPLAARSAIDLSRQTAINRDDSEAPARLITANRSVTDPEGLSLREQNRQTYPHEDGESAVTTDGAARPPSSDINRSIRTNTRQTFPLDNHTPPYPSSNSSPRLSSQPTLNHAVSTAAFATELATISPDHQSTSSIRCNRCDKPEIQYELHYNCRQCHKGGFNLCLTCYRNGRGCERWFGFGFRAFDRWARENKGAPQNRPLGRDGPHILSARKYIQPQEQPAEPPQPRPLLQEGAFCESCLAFADDGYWYCNLCLEGAWGFCSVCVNQGRHCTHPLQAVAHLNTVRGGHTDPTNLFFVALPHLRQDCYIALPPGNTECELCTYPILPQTARYHCYQCQEGHYDVCSECYANLVAHGKISQMNGPSGWRRCVKGHRMAVVDFQSTGSGAQVRRTVQDTVGGGGVDDNAVPQRPTSPAGKRCLALYSYFPAEGVTDELAFPKNAEIRDVEDKNGDWGTGSYAGRFGLFPMNHVRML